MQKVYDWTKEHTLRTFASGASSVPGAHQGWFIGAPMWMGFSDGSRRTP